MTEPIVTLKDVNFSYGEKQILKNVNLSVPRGSFLGLVGPNGGGKTTLIKIMLGMLTPDYGSITLLNEPIQTFKQWNKIGFVSQTANRFNRGFPATVFEVVAMGLTTKLGYFRFLRKNHKEHIMQTLELVNMVEYAHRKIGHLSGGQQQRVFIARALVSNPEIIILDEPTVGIDFQNVDTFYKLLYRLNREQNITLILVTHDTGVMTKYATDVACINETLHFHGNSQEYTALSEKELSKIYGHPVNVVVHDHD